MSRTPKYYSGTRSTNRHLKDLLPRALSDISNKARQKPMLVVEAWPELVGKPIGSMTRAVSFEDGILRVLVKNSTLYSLLIEHERVKLLERLRKKFPTISILNISFKIGWQ